ncbi:DNAJB12 [Mytilus coruscus]|uniref:DNAJB12 n=1 Tax=Mytilus coruscus TaxID=42192 RepID=A0A6J8D2Y9_MYTCO|nr:DNAJB12 [Mytilus coruscus]
MTQNKENNKSHESNAEYTKEQQVLVDRTLAYPECMYYDILEVPRLSPIEVISKSYRRLSLQLHPDKNKAPRSEEACKVINNAYDKLSDSASKHLYDTVELPNIEERFRQRNRTHSYPAEAEQHSQNQTYCDHQQTFSRRRTIFERMDEDFVKLVLMLGVPILILLLYPVISSLFSSNEIFMLRRSGVYTEQRFTSVRRIPYYVKKGYQPSNLQAYHDLEKNVELKYYRIKNSYS